MESAPFAASQGGAGEKNLENEKIKVPRMIYPRLALKPRAFSFP